MTKTIRLALALLLLTAAPSPKARADGAVVQGQIINGTAGAHAALGALPVTLYIFSGNTLAETRQATTDSTGTFRFSDLPAQAGHLAVASVRYSGVDYQSASIDLSAGTSASSDIIVYETTTDSARLSVERSHLIVRMGTGQLEIIEWIILVNEGDRSYIGSEEVIPGRRATVLLPLPAGASDVSFDDSAVAVSLVRTGQGYVDTRPIIPGTHEYLFSYALPCNGPAYDLLKPIAYPITALDVLIAAPGAEIDAPALEEKGSKQVTGTTYLYLAGRSLAAGSELALHFRNLGSAANPGDGGIASAPAATATAREPWWPLPLATLTLLSLLGLVWLHLSRQRASRLPGNDRPTGELEAECDRLLAALADLDETYEAAGINEERYRRQREEIKARLRALLSHVPGRIL